MFEVASNAFNFINTFTKHILEIIFYTVLIFESVLKLDIKL